MIYIRYYLLSFICIMSCGCGLLSKNETSSEIVSFIKGELYSKIDKDINVVYTSSQKVATESMFTIKSDRADAFSAVLKCEDAQQRKIDIILEKESEKLTRVRIRVGLLGDAELSNKIFEQIKEKAES